MIGAKRQTGESESVEVMMNDWICTSCGSEKDVEPRYSFGFYAGRLCLKCCAKYEDNCGVNEEQGDWRDLDEDVWGEDYEDVWGD